MPHSDDKPDGRDRPEDSSAVPTGRGEHPRADDPLAELARMVEDDPFAEFRRGEADAGTAPDEAPSQSYGPPDPTLPRSAAEPRVDRESLYAEIAAAQEREVQATAAPAEPEPVETERAEPEPGWPEEAEPEPGRTEMSGPEAAEPEWVEPEPPAPGASEEASDFDPVAALAAELQAMPPLPEPAQAPEADPDIQAEPWFNEWAESPAPREPAESANWPQAGEAAAHHWSEEQPAEAVAAAEPGPHFAEEELPFADATPPAADDGYVPTYVADDRQHSDYEPRFEETDGYSPDALQEERGGSRRGVMVVSSLVALVVLGGAAALGYRGLTGEVGGPSGEPPVIRADTAPAKTVADEPEDAADGQGKLVYDRIGGGQTDGDSRIVSREEPVFDVEARDDRPLRVIDPETDEGVRATDRGRRADPDEPRRVRTVVVRPDGTVVSNPEQVETALQPASDVQTTDVEAPGADDAPEGQLRPGEDESISADARAAAADDEDFVPPSADQTGTEAQAEPEPETETRQTETREPSGQPMQLTPQDGDTADATESQPEPEQVAQAPTTAPQTTEETAAQPASFPTGSYVVQVGSTRSEDDARGSASAVAQQHSDLLSGYQTAIERADLGDRGVFYRVGVGPVDSQSDADALCSSLRTAGTDCFVRRN